MGRYLRVALLAAVLALYASALDHTPPHMHHDEVVIALQAHSIATTARDSDGRVLPLYFRMPLLGDRVWYQPVIIYVMAPFLAVLPAGTATYRFPTAAIATLNVALMFLVARRLFGSNRWAMTAAALLAATPTHFMLGRVAFDFIYPLPFILGWLWALLLYRDRQRLRYLFCAAMLLGLGFYSYISSIAMMPLYFALTLYVLWPTLDRRTLAVAAAGFAWPLLPLIPWLLSEPTFIDGLLYRYSIIGTDTAPFRFSSIADRVTQYWSFFNPAFLFLIGGFTHLTASTRVVGVFLAPLLLLIPLGLIQMVAAVRTRLSVAIALGFLAAPLTAVLAVQDWYASSRQTSILVFGVLIAVYGMQRMMQWRGAGRVVAVAVLVCLPLHFAFFLHHYFGAYHGYAAAQFEWNHEDAMAAIIERNPRDNPRDVYVSATARHPGYVDSFWHLALTIHNRKDLLTRTHYFDSSKSDVVSTIPPGAFVFASTEDKSLLEAARSGQFTEVMRAPEPADEPVFYVLQRNPV
ncbi:MAG TPA: glycosyltransferase family 39 protein [Vicinamibacterales bacterium]|nr:glycosyltransferase family 39 protein [Vicinamibacterales bacterium]